MVIVLINAVLALVAFFALQWAALQIGRPPGRIASAMAFFYSMSYFWLAFNIDQTGEWSSFMRWFGLLSWPLVWIALPVMFVVWLRREQSRVTSNLREVLHLDHDFD